MDGLFDSSTVIKATMNHLPVLKTSRHAQARSAAAMRYQTMLHRSGALAFGAVLAAASAVSSAAPAAQLVAQSASSSVIEQHALAQQGFSIALASVVLQTHLYYALVQARQIDFTRDTCMPFDSKQSASGAFEVTIPDQIQSSNKRVSFYYDGACTHLYTTLDQSTTDPNGIIGAFYTPGGQPNGTLVTTGGLNETTFQASGLGSFVGPIGSSANASLGITCDASDNGNALNCAGGVVQNFTSINEALGSVTPLSLLISNTGALAFKSTQPAAFQSGSVGSLTLGYTSSKATALQIQGGIAYGTDTVSGEAGSFSLFPGTPTDWTDVDTAHDAQFQIHVVDNNTRQLSATISTISTGTQLASASLDQSGTGSITFSDGSKSAIYSWVIADSTATGNAAVNPDQKGLTGTWYNPATSGQGIVMQVFPDLVSAGEGLLFGGWFTYDIAPAGGADAQRWYSLQGPVSRSTPTSVVGIYTATGGNFNAPPQIGGSTLGEATLSFSDCDHGSLNFAFTDGTGRSGTIPLTRLDSNVSCGVTGDSGASSGDALLSGAWYNPATSGQGLVFDVSPGQNTLFAAWYTFAPNGAQVGGGASQRWYTLQAPLGSNGAATGLILNNVGIYTATGGVFNDPTVPVNSLVGTATVAFSSCNALTLSYSFSGGTNSGITGTIDLVRGGPTPAGCTF